MSLNNTLDKIEQTLIELDLWESEPPSPQQLNSDQPFALDTLSPTQWLQWIFLPKMQALIEKNQPLPTGFEISPYFEQAVSGDDLVALLPILKQLDLLNTSIKR